MSLIKKFITQFKVSPSEAFRKTIRRLLPYQLVEYERTSYHEHNRHYSDPATLEWQRGRMKLVAEEDLFNASANRIRELMAENPDVRELAIDIGSGVGWAAVELSRSFRRVIAIEPSKAAVDLGHKLFPVGEHPTIEWHTGFADEVIPRLSIQTPALWITMVVLSHLPNDAAANICRAVNRAAKPDSLLSFSECWGPEFHDLMWHVRTQDWWRAQLPGWDLTFHGPEVNDSPGRRKGIHGRKIR